MQITRSESGKVTIEFTLEELSGVENDLDVYVNSYDAITGDDPSDGTYEFLASVKAYWIGLQPKGPFDA